MEPSTRKLCIAVAVIAALLFAPALLRRQTPTAVTAPAVHRQASPTPPPAAAPEFLPPSPAPNVPEPALAPPSPAPSITATAPVAPPAPARSSGVIENAWRSNATRVPVTETGTVSRILSDDNKGDRHQRFIVTLSSGHTVLIAHNIDIAQRINNLREGDQITFSGLFEWNEKGGVVHWTHHDPSGRYAGGYLQHNGNTYR